MYAARKKVGENAVTNPKLQLGAKKVGDVPANGQAAKLRKGTLATNRVKRPAFGDLTNATKDKGFEEEKKKITAAVKTVGAKINTNLPANKAGVLKKKATVLKKETKKEIESESSILSSQESTSSADSVSLLDCKPSSQESKASKNVAAGGPADSVEEDLSFLEMSVQEISDKENESVDMTEVKEPELPVLSIDQENVNDVFNVGIYAQDIFEYYKRREKMFKIPRYMDAKYPLTPYMRSILVDWMVETQESFELNHETLYLAVKLTDTYLSRVTVDKENLQLVGSVAIFISSKFDERCPPMIEDFTYICDNAFDRDQFIEMEMEMLKIVGFDLGMPISYRFLRRYAKVGRLSIQTLTLARYILEMSLMEYDLIDKRDSLIAGAALYIAMVMKNEGKWEGDIVKASGYEVEDLKPFIIKLNKMVHAAPDNKLVVIRAKYSHPVFHQVAKVPLVPTERLL